MRSSVIEVTYPLSFRSGDAQKLGKHLFHSHSVDLIGMKRVGISNFLRFFLYHKDIVKTYIDPNEQYLFVPVDLNDLVEQEIFPFWTLTLKRIVDAVSHAALPEDVKHRIESSFLDSIQSRDLFLLIDSVRNGLVQIVEHGMTPVVFLLRFDRMKDVITPELFANLQGLKDATHQRLSYVFTSFRSLDELSPHVFTKASLSVFAHETYVQPAGKEDMRIVYQTYQERYHLKLKNVIEEALFSFVSGHMQYLQLALIILNEHRDKEVGSKEELFALLVRDERTTLQSEELWESLTKEEKRVLLKISKKEDLTNEEKKKACYLWDTGLVVDPALTEEKQAVFSPLLEHYLQHVSTTAEGENKNIYFSKKENTLFTLLQQNIDHICEREKIVEFVWPEYRELGVSDWAIDRLVARVRAKLKQQNSPHEIVTIRTRGYKLISS